MSESCRHELDEAIDRVAAKLVAVPDDTGLLSQTMARLPGRTAEPWFLAWPVQLTAGVALVLVALLYTRPSREVMPIAMLPVASPAVVAAARPLEVTPQLVATPSPAPRLRQGYGAQARGSAATVERPDHERSLAPVEAVAALELVDIATPSIDVESAAAIEPIILTDLALDPKGDE